MVKKNNTLCTMLFKSLGLVRFVMVLKVFYSHHGYILLIKISVFKFNTLKCHLFQ